MKIVNLLSFSVAFFLATSSFAGRPLGGVRDFIISSAAMFRRAPVPALVPEQALIEIPEEVRERASVQELETGLFNQIIEQERTARAAALAAQNTRIQAELQRAIIAQAQIRAPRNIVAYVLAQTDIRIVFARLIPQRPLIRDPERRLIEACIENALANPENATDYLASAFIKLGLLDDADYLASLK